MDSLSLLVLILASIVMFFVFKSVFFTTLYIFLAICCYEWYQYYYNPHTEIMIELKINIDDLTDMLNQINSNERLKMFSYNLKPHDKHIINKFSEIDKYSVYYYSYARDVNYYCTYTIKLNEHYNTEHNIVEYSADEIFSIFDYLIEFLEENYASITKYCIIYLYNETIDCEKIFLLECIRIQNKNNII